MKVAELFPVRHIRIDEIYQSRKRVLEVLSGLLADDELGGQNATAMFEALIARERLGCTAIGHGIAIPHGRVGDVITPRGAIVRLREGVDFSAPDGEPVDLIIGLIIPEDCHDQHLEVLGHLARHLSDPDERALIMEAQSVERVQSIVVDWLKPIELKATSS